MPGHRVDIGYDLLALHRQAVGSDTDIMVALRRGHELRVVRTDVAFLSRPGGLDTVVEAARERLAGGEQCRVGLFGFGHPVLDLEDRMWVVRERLGVPDTHIVHVVSGSWWSATCRDWCCSGESAVNQPSSTAELARRAVPLLDDAGTAAGLSRGVDMLLHGRQPSAGVLVQLANVVLDPLVNESLLRMILQVGVTEDAVPAFERAARIFAPPMDVGLLTVLGFARLLSGDARGCWSSVAEALQGDPWFLPAHKMWLALASEGLLADLLPRDQ